MLPSSGLNDHKTLVSGNDLTFGIHEITTQNENDHQMWVNVPYNIKYVMRTKTV